MSERACERFGVCGHMGGWGGGIVNSGNAFAPPPAPPRLCKSEDIVTEVTICYVEITFLPLILAATSETDRETDG